MAQPYLKLLRLPDVLDRIAAGKTRLYDGVKMGVFTKPVRAGKRASAWPEHEVEQIGRAIVAGATKSELRKLVNRLHRERTAPYGCAAYDPRDNAKQVVRHGGEVVR